MADASNDHSTIIQSCASFAATAYVEGQAHLNKRIQNFIQAHLDDFTQFNIPSITTQLKKR